MSRAEADRALYLKVLVEIRWRVDRGIRLLTANTCDATALESAAVHLRKVLELIVFGSLINNREEIEGVAKAFARKDVSDARKLVRKVNANYWPVGLNQRVEDGGDERVRPDQLQESEWGTAYGFASEILHTPNPYTVRESVGPKQQNELLQWFRKVVALLNHHEVRLANEDYLLRCLMLTQGGEVQVSVFKKVP